MSLWAIRLKCDFDFKGDCWSSRWQKIGIGMRSISLVEPARIGRHPLGKDIADHRRKIGQLDKFANWLGSMELQLEVNGVKRLMTMLDT